MRIYTAKNVYDAAMDRIRWLFDEFPNVVVAFSGGKDSTVVFHMALEVAREKGRLPLTVMWIDQEAEWAATVEQARYVMYHPDVRPRWYQIPMRLFNATSKDEHWLMCWDEAAKDRWMHPRDPIAVTENVYGTDRFGELFDAIIAHEYKGQPCSIIGGVRCEESPARTVGLTHQPTHKWATWGKRLTPGENHVAMYPLYDWSYTDVWTAIHKNGWPYNAIYDVQYSYGVPLLDMRVSNVHHETAVSHLFYMQEAEPETYVRLTQRIAGVDMAGKLGTDDYFVKELPFMFSNWREYRDYLLEKLIEVPEWRTKMAEAFHRQDAIYTELMGEARLARIHITSILTNDWELIKTRNFENSPKAVAYRKKLKGRATW
jgi:predicted phosphoadenosine phosphosulfate sulfurtransferase